MRASIRSFWKVYLFEKDFNKGMQDIELYFRLLFLYMVISDHSDCILTAMSIDSFTVIALGKAQIEKGSLPHPFFLVLGRFSFKELNNLAPLIFILIYGFD